MAAIVLDDNLESLLALYLGNKEMLIIVLFQYFKHFGINVNVFCWLWSLQHMCCTLKDVCKIWLSTEQLRDSNTDSWDAFETHLHFSILEIALVIIVDFNNMFGLDFFITCTFICTTWDLSFSTVKVISHHLGTKFLELGRILSVFMLC